jgi:hypothetical protein
MEMMTRTIVRRYFEDVLGGGRLDLLPDLVAPDYVDHTARVGKAPGPARRCTPS